MSDMLDVLLAKQDEYGALFDEARERDDFDAMMEHLEKMRVLSRIIADLVNPR
jgi:Zn-dependent M32 family carboxypeptidase